MQGETIPARATGWSCLLPDAAGGKRPLRPQRRCRWCCWCTAARGRATSTASTPQHQWLANRGLAVLSVNFRGSTGFGKAFLNAGDLEWGRKMHDDLIDAVEWAVDERHRRPRAHRHHGRLLRRLCDAGRPDLHARGVLLRRRYRRAVEPGDAAGDHPALLGRVLREPAPAGSATRRTEAGRKLLRERSPLHYAGSITKPLLIGQGANDPRVKQAESDQIIEAMRAKGLPVTYVLYPEEGHGFAVPENRLSFMAIAEAFLAAHLGGEAEPIGQDFEGAKLEVREGAPGFRIAAALGTLRVEALERWLEASGQSRIEVVLPLHCHQVVARHDRHFL